MQTITSIKNTNDRTQDKFVSLYIPYLGNRYREKNAEKKSNARLSHTVDQFDRKSVISIPTHLDSQEESMISKVSKQAIREYQEAWRDIQAKNKKYHIIKTVSNAAGVAVALVGGWVFGGGLVYLVGAGITGVLGKLVSNFVNKKIIDRSDIDSLAKANPKLAETLKKLDRKAFSTPHWLDKDEFDKLPPKVQTEYKHIVKEIEAHNKSTKRKASIIKTGSKILGYSVSILPKFLNISSGIYKTIATVGTFGLNYLAGKYTKNIVPVKKHIISPT